MMENYYSLKIENTRANAEMDEILSTLNEVEADIQSIRDAENYLNIQQQKGDLNKSTRERIKENMQLISETLKKNKQQISELEEKFEILVDALDILPENFASAAAIADLVKKSGGLL